MPRGREEKGTKVGAAVRVSECTLWPPWILNRMRTDSGGIVPWRNTTSTVASGALEGTKRNAHCLTVPPGEKLLEPNQNGITDFPLINAS